MIPKLFLSLFLCLSSCSAGGVFSSQSSSLEVHSMGLQRVVLQANCTTIVCTDGFANEGDVWMTDIPLEQLESGEFTNGQIIHLQVLWKPVAGKTPLTSLSTNISITYIILSEGNVGIYGGGGFCWMSGTPATGMILNIEDATIALQHKDAGFNDLLTPATMLGHVQAVPDNTKAQQLANVAELLQ